MVEKSSLTKSSTDFLAQVFLRQSSGVSNHRIVPPEHATEALKCAIGQINPSSTLLKPAYYRTALSGRLRAFDIFLNLSFYADFSEHL